jgi:hypothetical protein
MNLRKHLHLSFDISNWGIGVQVVYRYPKTFIFTIMLGPISFEIY